jgi:hypothetical protein
MVGFLLNHFTHRERMEDAQWTGNMKNYLTKYKGIIHTSDFCTYSPANSYFSEKCYGL